MGNNSGRRRHPQSPLALRWILIAAAGVAVVAVAVTAFALTGSGGKSGSQTKAIAQFGAPAAPRTPAVSRAETRTPLAMTVPMMIKKSGAPTAPTAHKSTASSVVSSGSCQASYYFGVPYQGSDLVSANKTLPFGTRVRVTNENNGESVVVRISDRGPFVAGRCLDLSNAAMAAIGGMGSGVIPVRYEVLA